MSGNGPDSIEAFKRRRSALACRSSLPRPRSPTAPASVTSAQLSQGRFGQ